jgi:hypothetical protein
MGVSAAIVVLLVAVTGALLNHTEDFQFDSLHMQSEWVLDWYGIKAPEQIDSFAAGDRHISLMGEHLYVNRREIEGEYYQLAGAVVVDDMFILAVSDSILLLTQRGEIIEHLGREDGVPAGIKQVGFDADGAVVMRTSHELYQPDRDFLRWSRRDHDLQTIRWATPTPLETNLKAELQEHFRKEILPLERVLLDLHSGRFFGRYGPWIFDIAAVLLVLLSLSGTWIWLKRRR